MGANSIIGFNQSLPNCKNLSLERTGDLSKDGQSANEEEIWIFSIV